MDVLPYLPWLDCVGLGFSDVWDAIHEALVAAVARAGVHSVALLPPEGLWSLLPRQGIARVFPLGGQRFEESTLTYYRVLSGELHPKHLHGHCLLGSVVLKFLGGRFCAATDPVKAITNFTEAWELLTDPAESVSAFDFLESSRWGKFLDVDTLWLAALGIQRPGASQTWLPTPWASVLHLLADERLKPYSTGVVGGQRRRHHTLPGQLNNGNLTAVAVSTHAAVLEPVASLRFQSQAHGVRMFTYFLGVLHPGSDVPCALLQEEDVQCSRPHGWGGDAHQLLFDFGDMRNSEPLGGGPSFVPELTRRLELLHRRHIRGRADLLVCAHPFLFCALLRALSAPLFMLVYLTPAPLTQVPEAERHWVLLQLALLASTSTEEGSAAVLAASPLYALQALYQTGAHVRPVRPSSLYIARRFRWQGQDQHRVFLWLASGLSREFVVTTLGFVKEGRRQGVPWLQEAEISVKELFHKGFVSWDVVAQVRCVVLLPWDLQLTVFPELYALGVPLVLPSAEYVASYGLRILRKWNLTFWAVHARFAGQLPGLQTEQFAVEPWVELPDKGQTAAAEDLLRFRAQFLYWFEASDFQTFGHTLRFGSIPEMLQHTCGTPSSELVEISKAMYQEWSDARDGTATVYAELVSSINAWVTVTGARR